MSIRRRLMIMNSIPEGKKASEPPSPPAPQPPKKRMKKVLNK